MQENCLSKENKVIIGLQSQQHNSNWGLGSLCFSFLFPVFEHQILLQLLDPFPHSSFSCPLPVFCWQTCKKKNHTGRKTHLPLSVICVCRARSAVCRVQRQWDHHKSRAELFCWHVRRQLQGKCCIEGWIRIAGNNPLCVCVCVCFVFPDKYAEFDLTDEGEIGEW